MTRPWNSSCRVMPGEYSSSEVPRDQSSSPPGGTRGHFEKPQGLRAAQRDFEGDGLAQVTQLGHAARGLRPLIPFAGRDRIEQADTP